MTVDVFRGILVAKNLNQRLAVREVPQDQRMELLVHYFHLASPIKNRCQNVTDSEVEIIRVMCELYNQFLTQQGGRFSRLKPSACQLPNNLQQVRRFLSMSGRL